MPLRSVVVPISDWRDELDAPAVLNRNAANPRQPFHRLRKQLQTHHLIGVRDGLLWKADRMATGHHRGTVTHVTPSSEV